VFERGPVIATVKHGGQRNAIGAHSGGYCIYTALAVAAGELNPAHIPNLNTTFPTDTFGPFASWKDPKKLVTIDPWGHMTTDVYKDYLAKGYDIRPTIAVTKAHIDFPEVKSSISSGRLVPDGKILKQDGQSLVTKAAIEPVWYLPGVAERFGCTEQVLRQALFKETNMMYPELLTRNDIKLFLPPIGGLTIYMWGDPKTIPDENIPLTVRVHDECNGSDVFGSDICTCRPYLAHAIDECISTAQEGGCGVVVYFRKEGRSLGEVTKYLVYNMRKRAEGGDQASEYFNCTKNVAGITDTRFQAMMPDALHWLGITKIHKLVSMSDMKYDAITNSGIKIVERVAIPPELIPKDAQVEIAAKVQGGYHGCASYSYTAEDLKGVKGRGANEY
jgi:GTP cyclohydrolase II